MNDVVIREATLDDATAIAALHVVAWQRAYGALAPLEVQAIVDEAFRLRKWREKLSAPSADQLVIVAERNSALVGFGAAGAPSEEIFGGRGEIRFLYIDPERKRQGVGRRLLSELVAHLQRCGYSGAALGVVEGNGDALAFYEALGGRVAGQYIDPGPNWRSNNLVIVWDDLSPLIGKER
ncbi:GNAT family N-acetyltransferase [Neorhizobium sp. P12A]|uniref:GNAT family N-acetyltransferase n=1 Tax=Neorhizobium sp. P12A TaxID=2268027 RepID=UPI0011EFC723|nr:GNAT family N-acetyltransferase [Neorhizobium sp. P12A]KAA0697622.1 GNAT family N-acetyltransferase [Neorhizobium sp. P12A]